MAETDWFNKPVENSRELILKEAFKLFLQKNVEKVTVPELERVTKLQRGAIFYHFKDKEAIFKDAVKQYFFSPLNIFYPINSNNVHSLEEYWDKKNEHLNINLPALKNIPSKTLSLAISAASFLWMFPFL